MYFFLGLLLGGFGGFLFYRLSARKQREKLEEDIQMLQQEKQIVVEFMHNLVEAIGDGVNRDELFQRIVHAAILSTGALSACVFERKDNKLHGVAVEGLFPPQRPLPESSREKLSTRAKFIEGILRSEVFDIGEGVIGSVAKSGKAILIEDATSDPRVVQHGDASLQVRSLVVAPIPFRTEVLGVLAVANPADGLAFNETDFSLIESLAEQAGLAIHNSDLMQVQMEKQKLDFDISMASSIQGMILPSVYPQLEGLDIDAFYRPAQKIGGDLYDVFSVGEKRVAFAIADVSGKGVPASLLMAICQTNLRHFAKRYDSPAEILRQMNREMTPEMRQDMFITLIFAVIDMEKDTLTMARAGHELLLLVHGESGNGTAKAEMVGSEGMAIGMVPSEIFDMIIEDRTVPFEKGDSAVFYTDGVTEASNRDGAEFSGNRLEEVALSLRDRSASGLNEGIVSTVERFTGGSMFMDDLTLIAVKHT
ncbi:GAF domain-containing SpoIIE family protein phosphatase [Cerasicoccus fimbriatus]|uniref:GAF domain-containing SpoIIE family protein phosphatase n=1 Tax=Cerasicoccus fimbriatus TaxID=3014554 RepID=UPI0022B33C39|nr:GAF domain-containing SpoIIE family protein phosphatase [Cerasicoccus sp. TK19100]